MIRSDDEMDNEPLSERHGLSGRGLFESKSSKLTDQSVWSYYTQLSAIRTKSTNVLGNIYDELDKISENKDKQYAMGQLRCEFIISILLTLFPWISGICTMIYIIFFDSNSNVTFKKLDNLSTWHYVGFSINILDILRYLTLAITVLLFRINSISFSYKLNFIFLSEIKLITFIFSSLSKFNSFKISVKL